MSEKEERKTGRVVRVPPGSVDSSAPTIISPWVRVPSTPSMLLSLTVKILLYLPCEMNEKKQKEFGSGPFMKIEW